jgi:hypothetical protein
MIAMLSYFLFFLFFSAVLNFFLVNGLSSPIGISLLVMQVSFFGLMAIPRRRRNVVRRPQPKKKKENRIVNK